MSIAQIVEELPRLSPEDRDELRLRLLQLYREIWTDASDPLTDAEKALLDARLAAYRKDPDAGSSWDEVEERLLETLALTSAQEALIQERLNGHRASPESSVPFESMKQQLRSLVGL